MLTDILFIEGDEVAIKVCAAWLHDEHPDKIARWAKLHPDKVAEEITRLKELGVLLPDRKLDAEAERFISTVVAAKVKAVQKGEA